jgi:hypothetical protein
VKISENPKKHLAYLPDSHLYKPLQRFELQEEKSKKQENLRLDYNPSMAEKRKQRR